MELKKNVRIGQTIYHEGKKLLVCKINKNTVTLREYTDQAIRGTDRRQMKLGDFYTATIVKK